MTIRELFDFIVDPTIADEAVDSYLEEVSFLILPKFLKNLRMLLFWLLSTYFSWNKKFWLEEADLWRIKGQTLSLSR